MGRHRRSTQPFTRHSMLEFNSAEYAHLCRVNEELFLMGNIGTMPEEGKTL